MVQTVSLDESEHAVTMLRGMKRETHLCDFRIIAEGNEYPAHKLVLSSGSAYFRAMLWHDTKESRDGKVVMRDVDHECVKSCIDFMYSGKFDLPDGKIVQLLHVATMLQLRKVKNSISDILYISLNVENFYETRDIAKLYDLQTVSNSCKIYYEENFVAISLQPGFQNEQVADLINIFESENLKISDKEKLTVSLKWAGENPSEKENIFELIKLIKLKNVPSKYLSDILDNDPVICNYFRLYKLIAASCIEKALENSDNKKDSNQIVLFDEGDDCLRSYDPQTDEVTMFHNEKYKHLKLFSVVSMDSYIYILDWIKCVHRLNFRDKNSKWEKMQNTIAHHGFHPPVVSFAGSLYVVGSSNALLRVVEIFVPAANQWLRLNDKPEATWNPTLVSLNDSIFCIGGRDSAKAVKSFCRFTPSTSEWVNLEPMKDARSGFGAVAVEQRIFVMGGWRDGERLNEVECYDVNSKLWSSLTRTITSLTFCVAHHIDGWIFLVGRNATPAVVQKYDIANDRWYKVEVKKVE